MSELDDLREELSEAYDRIRALEDAYCELLALLRDRVVGVEPYEGSLRRLIGR